MIFWLRATLMRKDTKNGNLMSIFKNDAAKYQYLFNAYANIDNGNYTLDDFRRPFQNGLE